MRLWQFKNVRGNTIISGLLYFFFFFHFLRIACGFARATECPGERRLSQYSCEPGRARFKLSRAPHLCRVLGGASPYPLGSPMAHAACGHCTAQAGWTTGTLVLGRAHGSPDLVVGFLPSSLRGERETHEGSCALEAEGAQQPQKGLSPSTGRTILCMLPNSHEQLWGALLLQSRDKATYERVTSGDCRKGGAAGSLPGRAGGQCIPSGPTPKPRLQASRKASLSWRHSALLQILPASAA